MKQWYSAAIGKTRRFLNTPAKKELQCHDVVIFYNLVFDIGKPVNPTQAARNLLKKEFACVSANHTMDTIEIAPRHKRLLKLREEAIQFGIFSSFVEQYNWKAALSWVLHHPKHALFALSKLCMRIGSNSGPQTNTPPQQKNATALKDAIKGIDDSMIKMQNLEGLHLYSDKQLFSPLYLREAPFVRVGLQPFVATIDGESIGMNVSLVIHRTGVAILTFGVMFGKPKTIDALIQ